MPNLNGQIGCVNYGMHTFVNPVTYFALILVISSVIKQWCSVAKGGW